MSSITFDRTAISNDQILLEDRTKITLGACLPLRELGVRCVRCNHLFPLSPRCSNCDGNGYANIASSREGDMGVYCNRCEYGWTDWTCSCGAGNRVVKTLVYIKKYADLKPQSLDEFLKLAVYHEKRREWTVALRVVNAGLQQFPGDNQLTSAANRVRQAEADEKAARERAAARMRREQEEAAERQRREKEEAAERQRRAAAEAEQLRLEAERRARAERRQRNVLRALVVALLLTPAALSAAYVWAGQNDLWDYLDASLVYTLWNASVYVLWSAIVCLWLLGAAVTAWVTTGGWRWDAESILMDVTLWPLMLLFDLPCALQIIAILLILFAVVAYFFR